MIAQLQSVDAEALKNFMLIVFALVGMAAGAKSLFVRKPSIDAEFATKTDLRATDDKIDKLRADIQEQFTGEGARSLRVAADLHEKINQVGQDVSVIRGSLEGRAAERAELVDALKSVIASRH